MIKKANLKKNIRNIIRGLPLAGIIVSSFLPLPATGRQLLILVLLVWFQIFILFDIFQYER